MIRTVERAILPADLLSGRSSRLKAGFEPPERRLQARLPAPQCSN
jgi:hypothetical protein